MCGIAGIFNLRALVLPESAQTIVRSMMADMAHRGPDGEGLWEHGSICLGHRRLSIIDLKGGAQPMLDHGKRFCTVFNGEIYNYRELREELENNGEVIENNSDTATLLAAYSFWGQKCLDRIEGMFAFAIYDIKNNSLFCARDHFGKKPFYYSLQNGYFVFASQLDALTRMRDFKAAPFSFALNPAALTRYLAYEYAPTPETLYSEARVLEPAHALIVDKSGLSISRYWDLPAPEPSTSLSEKELCKILNNKMRRAVSLRMISDVPLGVFLSGGIDSTIITGLMAEQSAKPVQSFSIGFTEASYDESKYARIAAKAYGTDHHEVILSADACAEELPGIIAAMDTPMADASCAPTWLLSALARKRVTVSLGGDGSDELWAGYEHYIGYKIALAYNKLPVFMRRQIEKLIRLLPESSGYINPRLAALTFLRGAQSPDWLRVQTMLTAMPQEMQRQVLNEKWLQENCGNCLLTDNLFAPTKSQYEHWQKQISPLARAFHVYCRQFLLDDILVKVDRCSMLHSLEVRAPFLDKNVAEFAAQLPIPYKLHGFKRKYLLKKAFAWLLPKEILHRNKRGFQIPVSAWLRGKLKPLLLEMARPEFLKNQGIFNAQGIKQIMDAHFSEKYDMRKPLWTFLVLQLWLQAKKETFTQGI